MNSRRMLLARILDRFVTGVFLFAWIGAPACGQDDEQSRDLVLNPNTIGVVNLRSGAQLTGHITQSLIDGREVLIVEMDNGTKITVPETQVDTKRLVDEKLTEYARLTRDLPHTLESHLEMVEWCKENFRGRRENLAPQLETHLRAVLEFEPNHTAARSLLGFTEIDGQWVDRDYPSRYGYVQSPGRRSWEPGEWQSIAEGEDSSDQKQDEYRVVLRSLRNSARPAKQQEYLTFLATESSRALVQPLIEQFEKEKNPDVAKLQLDAIGRQDSLLALRFLADNSVIGSDPAIRDRCLDLIGAKHFSQKSAAVRITGYLSSKDRGIVLRAGYVLGQLNQSIATLPLIKSLKTVHQTKAQGNQMQFGFGGNGGTGMQQGGGKPKYEPFDNQEVLDALSNITGVNFGFDESRWLQWYISEHAVGYVDLRRGDDE